MPTAIKSLGAALLIVLLLAGVAAVGYARWTRSIAEAHRSLSEGQWGPALGASAGAARGGRRGRLRPLDEVDRRGRPFAFGGAVGSSPRRIRGRRGSIRSRSRRASGPRGRLHARCRQPALAAV